MPRDQKKQYCIYFNEEGLSFMEWLQAAGYGTKDEVNTSDWHALVYGWSHNEDPTEWRKDAEG